jgi:hypothetical protein
MTTIPPHVVSYRKTPAVPDFPAISPELRYYGPLFGLRVLRHP